MIVATITLSFIAINMRYTLENTEFSSCTWLAIAVPCLKSWARFVFFCWMTLHFSSQHRLFLCIIDPCSHWNEWGDCNFFFFPLQIRVKVSVKAAWDLVIFYKPKLSMHNISSGRTLRLHLAELVPAGSVTLNSDCIIHSCVAATLQTYSCRCTAGYHDQAPFTVLLLITPHFGCVS